MNPLNQINQLLNAPFGILSLIVTAIVSICVFAIILAVIINFAEGKSGGEVQKEKKNVVETGSMASFFFVLYLLIKSQIGEVAITIPWLHIVLIISGLIVFVFGTFFNIWGRLHLGHNWANQIKIYNEHTLITDGPYHFVRHPLYASLIWMCFAGSMIYSNWLVAIFTLIVFIPMMIYRAKKEERMLTVRFNEYQEYKEKTGMFLPRIIISKS
ncbi:isoprenylcysteine carboxylmethyltransferase family protein [Patescibacteria group bacterium]|nr:isoprenylcysteine carboxylmethyltransferase family protein [Patescibacteria group bacterium]